MQNVRGKEQYDSKSRIRKRDRQEMNLQVTSGAESYLRKGKLKQSYSFVQC